MCGSLLSFPHLPCWSQRPGQGRKSVPIYCGLARLEAEEEAGKLLHPWLEIHPLLFRVSFLAFVFSKLKRFDKNLSLL